MHTLGISAATDVFRARGWDITLLIGQSHDELTAHFESSQDLLFGFSAGSAVSLEPLARLVVALTVARPAALVMVSGQIATEPEAIRGIPGIDFCAPIWKPRPAGSRRTPSPQPGLMPQVAAWRLDRRRGDTP